jgi:hypothetical protein
VYGDEPYAHLWSRIVDTPYLSRPPRFAVRAAPAARPLEADPATPRGLRPAAAAALAGSSLVLGPVLWLALAAWAAAAGLLLLAVPLGALGLLAAAASALLALRGARRPDDPSAGARRGAAARDPQRAPARARARSRTSPSLPADATGAAVPVPATGPMTHAGPAAPPPATAGTPAPDPTDLRPWTRPP